MAGVAAQLMHLLVWFAGLWLCFAETFKSSLMKGVHQREAGDELEVLKLTHNLQVVGGWLKSLIFQSCFLGCCTDA